MAHPSGFNPSLVKSEPEDIIPMTKSDPSRPSATVKEESYHVSEARKQALQSSSSLAPAASSASADPSSVPTPRPRMMNERIARAEARIDANKWDVEAWILLMAEVQTRPIDEVREYYERCISVFPTSARYWKQYIEHESIAGNLDAVAALFERSLSKVPHVDLWRAYIAFVRGKEKATLLLQQKMIASSSSSSQFLIPFSKSSDVCRAFEKALFITGVGADIGSTPIWQDYIAYIKDMKPANSHEEDQKITTMRNLFHRAIRNPMVGIESIFKDYERFEVDAAKVISAKFAGHNIPAMPQSADMIPVIRISATIGKNRRIARANIDRDTLARPPRKGYVKEEQQAALWRKFIGFEKSNPARLPALLLKAQVAFTYKQCLLALYHYPDIWSEYASYMAENGDPPGAVRQIYEEALVAMPHCLMLWFAYAEWEEKSKRVKEAKAIYERLLALRTSPAAGSSEEDQKSKVDKEGGVGPNSTLVDINYLKFIRRTEGMTPARQYFTTAFKNNPNMTYQFFVAAAMLEFHVNKDAAIARNIFEFAYKKGFRDIPFLLEFLDFLAAQNDETSLRTVLKRMLSQISAEDAKPIWDKLVEFERTFGDMTSLEQAEKQRLEAIPSMMEAAIPRGLVERYKYLDLLPCTASEHHYLFETDVFKSKVELAAAAVEEKRPSSPTHFGSDAASGAGATSGEDGSLHAGGNILRWAPIPNFADSAPPASRAVKPQVAFMRPFVPAQPPANLGLTGPLISLPDPVARMVAFLPNLAPTQISLLPNYTMDPDYILSCLLASTLPPPPPPAFANSPVGNILTAATIQTLSASPVNASVLACFPASSYPVPASPATPAMAPVGMLTGSYGAIDPRQARAPSPPRVVVDDPRRAKRKGATSAAADGSGAPPPASGPADDDEDRRKRAAAGRQQRF